jgi:hypothetical protein
MSNGTMSRDAIERELRNWSDGYWTSDKKYMAIYDPIYSIPSRNEVSKFLELAQQSIRSENTQNSKIWDCDQYSRYVWVEVAKHASKFNFSYKWPLGVVSGYFNWVGGGSEAHTCNWVYMVEGFSLIEPQNSSFHDIEDIVKKSIKLIIV